MSEKAGPSNWQELTAKLAQPFDSVEFLPRAAGTGQALALPFIDARDVQTRLDAVCGADWSFDFEVLSPDGKMVKGMLTIFGVTRCDAGEAGPEDEPLKSAVSDALKRCAVHFGVGRYLYHLPKIWAPFDAQKRRFTEKPTFEPRVISRAVAAAIGQSLGHPTPFTPAPLPDREEAARNREETEPAPETSGDRAAQSQPKPTPNRPQSPPLGAPAPGHGSLTCTREGCGKPITRGQQEMSVRNFGAAYCPACQKLQARAGGEGQGFIGGRSGSAPPADAPAKNAEGVWSSGKSATDAARERPKEPLETARDGYFAALGEKFGKLEDRLRYAVEAVLLGEPEPLQPGGKEGWAPGDWQNFRGHVLACDPQKTLEAARALVNVHAGSLPLSAPPTQPAAPSGLTR